jgi:hypothetical protein
MMLARKGRERTTEMNRDIAALAAIGLLILTGCDESSGGASQAPQASQEEEEEIPPLKFEFEITDTPTPAPTATPEAYFVIGKASLELVSAVTHDTPSGRAVYEEKGKIPIEIILRQPGRQLDSYEVVGGGLLTWVYDVNVTGGMCKYATTGRVTVTGSFLPDPDCHLALTLTANYDQPGLVTGAGPCGPITFDQTQFTAYFDAPFAKDLSRPVSSEGTSGWWEGAQLILRDAEIDYDQTGCLVGEGE